MLNILVRVDSSTRIGSGHLMRCRTLAEELKRRGAEVRFICRRHRGNLNELLRETFPVYELLSPSMDTHNAADEDYAAWLGVRQEEDAADTIAALQGWRPDWLVVDHYSLDKTWETSIRPYAGRIMVIDDLANRVHDCDLLLDQNFYTDMDTRYTNLVPCSSQLLLGPKYALLRPEFREARKNLRIRDGKVQRILVFLGGTDPTNETAKVIQALKTLELECIVDVVVGASNPNKEGIKKDCAGWSRFYYHEQINNMAQLMVDSDLAIGAAGSTSWERCCLGVPSIIFVLAENQQLIANSLQSAGAIKVFPVNNDVKSLCKIIEKIVCNFDECAKMSIAAALITVGNGTNKVASKLKTLT